MNAIKFLPVVVAIITATPAQAQHAGDILVGQSGGRLAWSLEGFEPGEVYVPLQRVETFLVGWSGDEPGFEHADESFEGVSPLSGSLQVMLEVVSLDPALYVLGSNLSFVLDSAGDRGLLGDSTLHTHVTWFVDETDPSFDAEQCVWEGTFRLVDGRNTLSPSEPFTMLFSIVPVRGGEFPPTDESADGDFDGDLIAELDDVPALIECLWGPAVRPNSADPTVAECEVECYNAFDFDDDLDIDLKDIAGLQRGWGR